MSVFEMVFSPTGGTRKVSGLVSEALDGDVATIDLTDSGFDFRSVSMAEDDVAVISVPAYAGRVPAVAVDRLSAVRGNGARAVLVCVYGNRAFEDTLVELEDVAKRTGFRVVAAVAAIAEHSVARQFAAGRPDAQDVAQLAEFAQRIRQKLLDGDMSEPSIPGNRPYRQAGGHSMVPQATGDCVSCVPVPRRALFELSTRTIPGRLMARRASPACVALPYAQGVLASLIPLRFPPLPRC